MSYQVADSQVDAQSHENAMGTLLDRALAVLVVQLPQLSAWPGFHDLAAARRRGGPAVGRTEKLDRI